MGKKGVESHGLVLVSSSLESWARRRRRFREKQRTAAGHSLVSSLRRGAAEQVGVDRGRKAAARRREESRGEEAGGRRRVHEMWLEGAVLMLFCLGLERYG